MTGGRAGFWQRKRIFLTGHTGFKGSWLTLMLRAMGAHVTGYSLAPSSDRDLFVTANVAEGIQHILGDVRDLPALTRALKESESEIVIHMAAQSLVRQSYVDPVGTYGTNVMGTVNMLEATRLCPTVRSAIIVTSDKCYENLENGRRYRETDGLGGHDPYASSKACAELVTQAYRSSFFNTGTVIASVRAGNVIGGGDWAENRLIPDLVRGALAGRTTDIRNPGAIRPWQHVLDPLSGYLALAEGLLTGQVPAGAYNFGPSPQCEQPVSAVADGFCKLWGDGTGWQVISDNGKPEAGLLQLDSSLARHTLGWRPQWPLAEALHHTVDWYRRFAAGESARTLCLQQIKVHATDDRLVASR